jgi:hypothetical protein
VSRFHIIRRRLFTIIVVFSVIVIVAFSVAGASLYQNHRQAKHDRLVLCAAQNHSNEVLRKILLLAKSLSDHPSPFYSRALKLIVPINCARLIGGSS